MSEELQAALTARPAAEIEMSIRAKTDSLQRTMLSAACDIGLDLTDLKAKTPHGEWGATLKRLGYSSSTAGNFMRLYAEYGTAQVSLFGGSNCQTFGNLSYSKALALLAVPAEEREQFAEEVHAEELSVRQLRAKIQEAEAAAQRAAADAEAKGKALEEAQASAAAQAEQAQSLQAELDSLKARPVEVTATVDATPEQLREAERKGREDALAAASKDVEALARSNEALKRQSAELTQALEAARLETDQYQGANEELLAQVERLKKAAGANEPLVELKLLFLRLQETANAMLALLPQVDEVSRAKLQRALPGALRQMADRIGGAGG